MRTIEVVDYDPAWPDIFERLRSHLWPVLQDVALSIEHVGSTSVPGLAAKPVIDMNAVVESPDDVPRVIIRLETLGYVHRGDLGIKEREAFHAPADLPDHHLYVSPADSLALRNHLAVRDYLRAHPEAAREYGELKRELAVEFHDDIEAYVAGKTAFIVDVLRKAGLPSDQLAIIEAEND